MKYLVLSIFLGLTANAQVTNPIIQSKNIDKVEVLNGKKKYSYDFLFPKSSTIDSYFIKSDNDLFYIKYEYKGSANSTYWIVAEFKWKDEKISLTNYISLTNQRGKWSGVVNFLSNYVVRDFEKVQDILFTIENNSGIQVLQNSQEIGILNIPKKIEDELSVDDQVFFEISSHSKAILK